MGVNKNNANKNSTWIKILIAVLAIIIAAIVICFI